MLPPAAHQRDELLDDFLNQIMGSGCYQGEVLSTTFMQRLSPHPTQHHVSSSRKAFSTLRPDLLEVAGVRLVEILGV